MKRIMLPLQAVPAESSLSRSLEDERLESLLVHLLGRLEQQMTTLERTDSAKRMVRMIETALGILVTVIDTGVDHFDINFFTHELPAVWRLRERSKVVLDVLDRESWTSVLGLSPKANSATQVMQRNLSKNLVQILRDLFARFGEEFQSNQSRNDWQESCEVFLEDFGQRW